MNNSKTNAGMILLIEAIGFVTYNVVLFAICGFDNHGASFWISYVFMLLAFLALVATGLMLKNTKIQPKDWFLGYPVLKHSVTYIITELALSILFMILDAIDCKWWIGFSIQLIALAVHVILVASCFLAQSAVQEVQSNTKVSTSFIKLLQVDVETLASRATDPAVKEAFQKLAEQVRYSDPVSNPGLIELERQITLQVGKADSCISYNDTNGALNCCNSATLLLMERNKKCKALK